MIRFASALILIGFAMLTIGCGARPLAEGATGPGPGSAGATLITMGNTFIWIGGAALVIGAAMRLWLKLKSGVIIAETGVIAILFGTIFTWLGHNLWMAAIACGVALVAWVLYRRHSILRWLRDRAN